MQEKVVNVTHESAAGYLQIASESNLIDEV